MGWEGRGGEGRGGGGVSLNLIGQFGKMVLDLQLIHNMLEPTIDLELRPWPWILKVRVWNSYISGIGRANWHVTKGIWVHTMSDPLSELQLWPWPWIIKVKFWSRRILRMKWPIDIERKECQSTKGMSVHRMLDALCYLELLPQQWPWPWIFKVKFWNNHISGMGGLLDMERKGCESIGSWTHFGTFIYETSDYDLVLGFSRSNFETVLSPEWKGWWHGMKRTWVDRMWHRHFFICYIRR